MTEQKAVVEAYTEGFRTGDLAKILSCLTDDVVWALHGDKTLVGDLRRWFDEHGGELADMTLGTHRRSPPRLSQEGRGVA